MLWFGHLGIGSEIVRPLWRGRNRQSSLPWRWLLLGTVLSDLIDKPLFYGLHVVPGTRSFGHTACFALALSIGALIRKSRILAALALGVASHLLLDQLVSHHPKEDLKTLLWPALGWEFPYFPYLGASEHFFSLLKQPVILGAEALGLALLARRAYLNNSPLPGRRPKAARSRSAKR